jgi:hypothetical protein
MASYTFQTVTTGSNAILEYAVDKTAADILQLKLYTNDATITVASVVGDLTECADATYAAYALTPASWTIVWDTDRSNATFTVDNTITFTDAASIYGMYLTNAAGTILIGAADFGAVKSFDAGDQLIFTEGILALKPV